jgi:hypothetical protein
VGKGIIVNTTGTKKKARLLKTKHTHAFGVPVFPSTAASLRNPDKAKLKETILALRAAGWSYRQIGCEVGVHWTRVGQILRQVDST